jgi:corrinoid protein of di/trimethylamine methyltransferase
MESQILEGLKKAVLEYDGEAAADWADKAVEQKVDPLKALDALTGAIRQVGEGFGKGDLWLPDLVGAADAMKKAMPIIEEEISRSGKEQRTLGVVVIGTVRGDLHDIGKTMVATMLTAEGFTVHDLGIDVPAEQFVVGTKEHKADILAMSALLTTTAPEQRKVIEMLAAQGLRDRVKVMVGGGAITENFAESVGADGYDPTAPGAAKLARKLLGK